MIIRNSSVFVFVLFFLNSFSQKAQSPVDFSDCSFTAVAHRGYSEFYPEDTLLAIEEAFKRGIKYCEVDVAISKDGVYVLSHDPHTISRTTDGTGAVSDNSYATLMALETGKWKESYFEGTSFPLLVDALKLAQKYDACLYLDVKNFSGSMLKQALLESGADPIRMMPAITTIAALNEFKDSCPDSPWVWFGGMPENPEDVDWYKSKVQLGCKVFELAEDDVLKGSDWASTFIDMAHDSGAKVWVYTVNNEEKIKEYANMGFDGVETDRPYVAQLAVCGYNPVSDYPKKETTGNWNFKKADFESNGVGSRLKNFQKDSTLLQSVEFGTTSYFGIAPVSGMDVTVAKIPAYNPHNGLFVYDNFMMEDYGALDASYSVIVDLYVASVNKGKYISLLQTNPDNLGDADFFINPDGQLGTLDSYHGNFDFDTWHRLVFVLDGNAIRKYLDEAFIGETEAPLGLKRWPVFNNMAYHGKHGFLLFSDNDNETAAVYINALQLRNYAMSEAEVSLLGGVSPNGIPVNNKKLFSTGIDSLETEMIDWEQQTIFIKQKSTGNNFKVAYDLQLSYGAKTDIPTSGWFNFKEGNGSVTFKVIAADGSSTNWTIQNIP
ncbi:hypothetical protein DI487_09725 [Flavobacterium sediminis]|uniref:GP-PDE domain-containing protein n=1 Tax=Flavobacterium sediminis TaxID=2201181 RepID=A0A2U8QW30_9FLAO|nr:glycerophosphodiester phosphodiesterase family protein [Flavobacterium sediminis]AWM14104.1 hypothetical protein DI487_09725 [Flavobacterium sediminis]